jgi:hypothetical protein
MMTMEMVIFCGLTCSENVSISSFTERMNSEQKNEKCFRGRRKYNYHHLVNAKSCLLYKGSVWP